MCVKNTKVKIEKLKKINPTGLGCSLVSECLLSMCETLGLIPSITKSKKIKIKI